MEERKPQLHRLILAKTLARAAESEPVREFRDQKLEAAQRLWELALPPELLLDESTQFPNRLTQTEIDSLREHKRQLIRELTEDLAPQAPVDKTS